MRRLEIEENMPFQERTWLVQRIAWIAGGAIIIAALAGLLGNGPATRSVVELPGGGEIRFHRVLRNDARCELVVHVPAGEGPWQLSVDQGFLDDADVESLEPEPARILFGERGWRLHYERFQPSAATVRLTFRPRCPGSLDARIALNAAPEALVRQFVLP